MLIFFCKSYVKFSSSLFFCLIKTRVFISNVRTSISSEQCQYFTTNNMVPSYLFSFMKNKSAIDITDWMICIEMKFYLQLIATFCLLFPTKAFRFDHNKAIINSSEKFHLKEGSKEPFVNQD